MAVFASDNDETASGKVVQRYLKPGEFCFCDQQCQLRTLLGSCITITLWHPQKKIGGMCHFVLEGDSTTGNNYDGRYLMGAIAQFERAAHSRGTQLSEYQAKVFGGGDMKVGNVNAGHQLIGQKNAAAAIAILKEKQIPILVNHTGLTGHRQIIFELSTGDVWMKHEPI